MRNLILSILAIGAASVVALPAGARAPANVHHPDSRASILGLRLRSIEMQIDIMADREMIGRQEARELRQEAQRLEQRLDATRGRDSADVEMGVDRLQALLRTAADGARFGDSAFNRRRLGRFDDGERYRSDEDDYDRDSYERNDPRGDPFAIWEERDRRDQGIAVSPH